VICDMKSKLLSLIVAVALVFSVQSCGKYDEGPGLSFRSKKARVAGTWKLSKSSTNGVNEPLDADDKDDELRLDKDGTLEFVDPGNATIKGTWDFESDKEKLKFTFNLGAGRGGSSVSTSATIIRLANKEMILESIDGTDKNRSEYVQ
jgi:hypothetical protein